MWRCVDRTDASFLSVVTTFGETENTELSYGGGMDIFWNNTFERSLNILLLSCSRRILTETETELISQKRFSELVEQQKKMDAEIDAQLSRQEDDLRLEEEVT